MPNTVPVTSNVNDVFEGGVLGSHREKQACYWKYRFWDLTERNRHVTGNTGFGINETLCRSCYMNALNKTREECYV